MLHTLCTNASSLKINLININFNWTDCGHFDHLCKEKLSLDTIELYDEPISIITQSVKMP